jgi:hypothetical protein
LKILIFAHLNFRFWRNGLSKITNDVSITPTPTARMSGFSLDRLQSKWNGLFPKFQHLNPLGGPLALILMTHIKCQRKSK